MQNNPSTSLAPLSSGRYRLFCSSALMKGGGA